jgi:hypothetical protein
VSRHEHTTPLHLRTQANAVPCHRRRQGFMLLRVGSFAGCWRNAKNTASLRAQAPPKMREHTNVSNYGDGLHVCVRRSVRSLQITAVGDACHVDPDCSTRAISSAVTYAHRCSRYEESLLHQQRLLGFRPCRYSCPERIMS